MFAPRQVTPQRRIPIGRRSVTGRMGIHGSRPGYESTLERDTLILLGADRSISGVVEQPVRIPYRHPDGSRRTYIPDFEAARTVGRTLLIEVKYRDELRERWAELRPRFRAAVAYAAANGLRFRIFDDVRVRTPLLANLKFLRAYSHASQPSPSDAHLVEVLRRAGTIPARELLLRAYQSHENRMRAVAPLWSAVRSGWIAGNLHMPLTMASPLWVPQRGLDPWSATESLYDRSWSEMSWRQNAFIGTEPPKPEKHAPRFANTPDLPARSA